MTSKLKCPWCEQRLRYRNGEHFVLRCPNLDCKWEMIGTKEMWQALIQSQRDLQTAVQALKEIKKVCDGCRWCDSNLYDPTPSDGRRIAETTNKALEQIEHKE